ncbi:ABC transporter substrate-binding protein [Paenibacillus baekrokdamisoli]|uniref:ABC transporter substrate-binding protein n=1 Tax=Paenibacillus baekrokdamisoli TaxID=1712516 RepID=A0A3G9IRA3_9BACL|nr:extracellular solute-binding protein [Paenibacillus baekrokdamisoli]MBB3070406.1 ABC-type glycerol-3-phosphate transport system substrate-binding protein [Paenibacillus baekrokdamisoli]BBH21407.1 ABC transporter substrate-binding protein [Paenibacillus baekrokdamisoli]
MNKTKTYRRILIFVILLLVIAVWRISSNGQEKQVYPVVPASMLQMGKESNEGTPIIPNYTNWREARETNRLKGLQQVSGSPLGESLQLEAIDYSAASEDIQLTKRQDKQKGSVIDWTNANGWMEWVVDVPRDGLYELQMDYYPLDGSFSNIVRGVQIDKSFPYQEAEFITLERLWKDSQYPYERNKLGNEIRPVQQEIREWRNVSLTNYGVSSESLLWDLTKGKHTIRLTGGREALSIASLTLASPKYIPSYGEYIEAAKQEASSTTTDDKGWYKVIEAEHYRVKSSNAIHTASLAERFISPDPKGRLIYNTIGGDSWQQAGNWIEWELEVPANGWYAIDYKYFQGYNGKTNVYRTVMLDGEVPFRELLHYTLPPNQGMNIATFADGNGKSYSFWLEKGKHQLRLIADSSLLSPAIDSLKAVLTDISVLDREIRLISGNYGTGTSTNLDIGRNWQIKTYDPAIEEKLTNMIDHLRIIRDYLNGLNQNATDSTNAISASMNRLEKLQKDVNKIPNQIQVFSDIQTSINTWLKPMESQAVMLDYIIVRAPEADPGLKTPNTWDSISYSMINFTRTFFLKYDMKELNEEDAITVWVQRGRDYVDQLQKMIESDFTPKTGIRVNVNLMPSTNVLILGNAAGDQPDVALGVGMETPVEFAMRGAAMDLSQLPGFEEVEQRFNPGVMRSYHYNNGVFGLPETQSFLVMFYRTDVLEALKLSPPNTWDELLELLPTLQENGMNIYYPAKEFVTPFYQHGAEFYSADGMQTTINSQEGQEAFKWWTALFNIHNMPMEVPAFFNHFRFGDIPIGIADYNTYIQLSVAAPEIIGKWKMAPLPGVVNDKGQVVRWSSQSTTAGMIMEKSKKKDEAWAFLNWWTSADSQAKYANDIEALAGMEYRWNPANREALKYVPWPSEEMEVLAEQGRWGKNMPYVPGYYFLGREMDFAWNNSILTNMPAKEALRKAAVSLQREMTRKQKELGFGSGGGQDSAE